MPPINQEGRFLAINTTAGDDVLALRSMTVQEQLGRMFRIEAELSSENGSIDLGSLLGTNATLRLNIGTGTDRFFNGFISRLMQTGNKGGYAHYRATIVPWLWFLTRTSDCRIFQNKTAPEILEAVFSGHGFNDFQISLTATYAQREYCVQYRETDFNFVSRLMEEEGIYYFFKHENGKHTLVLADSISAHSTVTGYDEIGFSEIEHAATPREVITEWTIEKEAQAGSYALDDFNFEIPKASMRANASAARPSGAAQFEMFDAPGFYAKTNDGDRLATVRIDELQTQFEVFHGQATARGLASGSTFTLKGHPRTDQNGEYLTTGVTLRADGGAFASGGEDSEFFSCNFNVVAKAQQFRPARVTPKPFVQGPQTAIVTGPAGDEIHTDKYGRVTVQFHWDRYGKADENSSCWVRVSEAWAGKKWGAIYLPRVGQEVIVDFLEGDPDRPIITGRVYNADNMPPYDLPGEKTKSTTKSNSTIGGGGFNEIRFEDKKGSEQIFVYGEKNMDVRVKADAFESIGNNKNLVVEKDQLEDVKNNRSETVDQNHKEKIGADRNLNVVGKEAKAVGGSLSLSVTGDVIEVFKAKHSEVVTSNYYLKADNIVIEAMTNLTVKVGSSYIAIEAGGISIGTTGTMEIKDSGGLTIKTDASAAIQSGASTSIKASAALSIQSSASAEFKGPQVTISGDATTAISGGIVKIN